MEWTRAVSVVKYLGLGDLGFEQVRRRAGL